MFNTRAKLCYCAMQVVIVTPDGLPDAPQSLHVELVTNDSITIAWLPPAHSVGAVLGYVYVCCDVM